MINLVSYNGKLIPQEDLRVPFFDRGFLFGDGAFTTMRVHNGIVENIGKHLLRLKQNCKSLNIALSDISKQWIRDLITENNALDGTWRLKLIVTGGTSKGLGLEKRSAGDIVITLAKYNTNPSTPYKLSLFPFPVISPTAKVKSLAYLDRLWIKDFALKNGSQDALTTMFDGTILETAFSNIFWIGKGVLYTPSLDLPLLRGTYLSSIIEGAQKLKCRIVELREVLENIALDSHVFVCNSLMGIQPVDYIDQTEYNRDNMLEESLHEATRKVISADILDIYP